jgi:hypothetical protein
MSPACAAYVTPVATADAACWVDAVVWSLFAGAVCECVTQVPHDARQDVWRHVVRVWGLYDAEDILDIEVSAVGVRLGSQEFCDGADPWDFAECLKEFVVGVSW